jgi:hypothetical protein
VTAPELTFAELLETYRQRLDVARDMYARPNIAEPVRAYWHGRTEALETLVDELQRVETWR